MAGCTLRLGYLDALDGTPPLDLKPYVPAFDRPARAKAGWLQDRQKDVQRTCSDGRLA